VASEVADLYVTLRSITTLFTEGIAKAAATTTELIAQLAELSVAADRAGVNLGLVGREGAAGGAEAAAGMERAAVATNEATVATERATVATRESAVAARESAASQDLLGGKVLGLGGVLEGVTKVGALGIAGISVEAVKMASTFQSSTTRLITSAGESASNIEMVRKGLLAMAGQVGVSADELSSALYFVEAAGYRAGDGLTVLKAAAQGAAAEGADTTTVAKALTDILVDYHLPATAAANVTSQMIAAVAHGKTTLQEFSSAFASIVPAASAAGISYQDVTAALAQMTNHGFTATRASQNLAQALRSMLNPTKTMYTAFDEYGVNSDVLKEKLAGPNGLTDAMEYISKAATKAGDEGTTGFAAALKRLMGTAPGANAALATVGANYEATAETIKAVGASTADASGKVSGFALVQQTLGQQLKDLRFGFDATMIRLGDFLIPQVSKFITLLESKGSPIVKDFTSAVAGIAQGFTGKTTKPGEGKVSTTGSGEQHGGARASVPLTPMQELGKILRGVADDVGTFVAAGVRLAHVLEKEIVPQVEKIGGAAILGALTGIGTVLAHVVAPAMTAVSDWAEKHKTIMTWIIDGFLIPFTARLALLATVKTVSAVAGLARDIVSFPFSQTKQILDQMGAFKSSLFGAAGTADAEGNVVGAVQGLFPKIGAALKTGWAGLKTGGSAVGDVLSGAASATSFQLQSMIGAFKDAGSKLTSTVAGWGSSIAGAVKGVMPTKVDAQMFLQSVKDTGSRVASTVAAWGSSIGTAVSGWASTAASSARSVGSSIATSLSSGLSALGGQTATLWASFTTAVQGAGVAAKEAAISLLEASKAALEGAISAGRAAIAWIAQKIAVMASAIAEGVMTAAQWLLNTALDANPIALVIIGITALVAALIYAWNHCTTFRLTVLEAFRLIGEAAMWLWREVFVPAFDGVRKAISVAIDFVKGLPGMISGFFSDAGTWLYNAGYNIIVGLWNGIQSCASWIGQHIGDLIKSVVPGPVLKILGINSPSRVFHEIGMHVTEGLAQGITAGSSAPAEASRRMALGTASAGALTISGGSYGSLGISATASPATGGQLQPIVVNVDGKKLFEIVQEGALKYGRRNSTTGLTYA
jgi:TP901 family phage tail tape measure protein